MTHITQNYSWKMCPHMENVISRTTLLTRYYNSHWNWESTKIQYILVLCDL